MINITFKYILDLLLMSFVSHQEIVEECISPAIVLNPSNIIDGI